MSATNYNPNAIISNDDCIYFNTTPYTFQNPYMVFQTWTFHENNPLTMEGVSLGEKLFNDPILSADNSLACINCHQTNSSFSDPNPFN